MQNSGGRMLPTTRLGLDVQVLVDDTWHDGTLEHWRQTRDGDWEGWVRWSTGPGETRIGWFGNDAIKPIPSRHSGADRTSG